MRFRTRIHRGFTLIELVFVVAVVSILVVMAVPSFTNTIQLQAVKALASDFSTDLQVARAEAARSGRAAIICASGSGTTCGGAWTDGWLIAVDLNANNVADANEVVRVHDAARSGLTLVGSGNGTISRFVPNGSIDVARTFTICGSGVRGSVVNIRGSGIASVYLTTAVCP